jgi:hypothetical protein
MADEVACAVKLAVVLIIFIILVFLTCALTLHSTRFALFDVRYPLEVGLRRLSFWSGAGGLGWQRIVFFVPLTVYTILSIHGSDFLSGQEASTRTAWATHGVVVSGLVQIRFSALGSKTEGIFEFLACKTPLKNPVELLCVDVQRRFFCLCSRYKLR